MDNMKESVDAVAIKDQTVISGYGVNGNVDFSLTSFDVHEPSATSTAAVKSSRETSLESEGRKLGANDICPKDFVASLLRNTVNNSEETNEITFKSLEQSGIECLNDLRGSDGVSNKISRGSNLSELFPDSSLLRKSNLVSFSNELETVTKDFLHEIPSAYVIPSDWKSESPSSLSWNVWDDEGPSKRQSGSQEHQVFCPVNERVRKVAFSNELKDNISAKTSDTGIMPANEASVGSCSTTSTVPQILISSDSGSAVNEKFSFQNEYTRNKNAAGFQDYLGGNQSVSFVDDEEFQSYDKNDMSAAEKSALQRNVFEAADAGLARDISGYTDIQDLSLRAERCGEFEENPNIPENQEVNVKELIFRSKSHKVRNFSDIHNQMSTFMGFHGSLIESPEKSVPEESTVEASRGPPFDTLSFSDATDTSVDSSSSSSYESRVSVSDQSSFANDDHFHPNDRDYHQESKQYRGSDVGSKDADKDFLDMLRKLTMDSAKADDPNAFMRKYLVDRFASLSESRDDYSVTDSFESSTSEEINNLKMARRDLQNGQFNSKQSLSSKNVDEDLKPTRERQCKALSNITNFSLVPAPSIEAQRAGQVSQYFNSSKLVRTDDNSFINQLNTNSLKGSQEPKNKSDPISNQGHATGKDSKPQCGDSATNRFTPGNIVEFHDNFNSGLTKPTGRMRMGTGSLLRGPDKNRTSNLLTQTNTQNHSTPVTDADTPQSISDFFPDLKSSISDQCTTWIKSNSLLTSVRNPLPEILKVSLRSLDVDVLSESGLIDFGIVAEVCLVRKEVMVVNRSEESLPVLVKLNKVQVEESEVFTFQPEGNPKVKLINSLLAATELPPMSSTPLSLLFRAPRFETFQCTDTRKVVDVCSELEILLDTPFSSDLLVKKVPIKSSVFEVRLRTQRSNIPVKIDCGLEGTTFSSIIGFINRSLFPLSLKANVAGNDGFSVSPSSVAVEAQGESEFRILFSASTKVQEKVAGNLLICVEPDGLKMPIPVEAHSNLGPLIAPPTSAEVPESKPIRDSDDRQRTTVCKGPETEEKLSMSANRINFMFGAVEERNRSVLKMTLRNNWTSKALTLNLVVKGEGPFYFLGDDGAMRKFNEVVLSPGKQFELSVLFEPSATKPYSAQIICKPRGLSGRPVKMIFPLYGFGGSGSIHWTRQENIRNAVEGCVESLSFGKLSPNCPSLVKSRIINRGTRTVCVKLRILHDAQSEVPIPAEEVCIQPSEVVLEAGHSKEIILLSSGSTITGRCSASKNVLGFLQIVYVNEILRQRFRKLKGAEVKWRQGVKDHIRTVDFCRVAQGEIGMKEAEEDPFGQVPEDDAAFRDDCCIIMIPIEFEVDTKLADENFEASLHLINDHQQTQTSFLNFSHMSSQTKLNSGVGDKANFSTSNVLVPKFEGEFEVFPSRLDMTSSEQSAREITVKSYKDVEQILEVSCEDPWLSIEPQELPLKPRGSVVFEVRIHHTKLPKNPPKISSTSFKILGQNDEKVVKVTMEMDSNFSRPNISNIFPAKTKMAAEFGSRKCIGNIPDILSENCDSETPTKEHGVQFPSVVRFPATRVNEKSVLKVRICNFDSEQRQIKILSECKNFVLLNRSFHIEAQRSVFLSILFCPKVKGRICETVSLKLSPLSRLERLTLQGTSL